MGFCFQVKLLLWKNLTLKKRKPVVLFFELFLPLVLFFILLGIRKNQPSYPVGSSTFHAYPLPSAGVIAVMQAFCDNGIRDKEGFLQFPNSSVNEFLTKLNSVAKNHNFFRPDITPNELDEIPIIYRNLIEDPVVIHDKLSQASNVTLRSLLKNPDKFVDVMKRNFSLSEDGLNYLLDSKLDMKQIYRHIFVGQNYSGVLDPNSETTTVGLGFEENPHPVPFLSLDRLNWVLNYLNVNKEKAGILGEVLNWIYNTKSAPPPPQIDPVEFGTSLKELLLTPSGLRTVMCSDDGLPPVILHDPKRDAQKVMELKLHFCNLSDDQLDLIVDELKMDIDSEKLTQALPPLNVSEAKRRVNQFVDDIRKFSLFEKTLYELSELASALPQDACSSLNETAPETNQTVVSDTPADEEQMKRSEKKPKSQYGLLRIWFGMQRMVCGKESQPSETAFADGNDVNLDDLGMSKYQQEQIKIVLHLLYRNPKLLYAPNNTEADAIIKKANETFELLDVMTVYAHKMLDVSDAIRLYLMQNSTEHSFAMLEHIRQDLQQFDALLNSFNNLPLYEFVNSTLIANRDVFQQQLDNIDKAACSWISLMSGIGLNMFKGFSSEEDLINYFKHKAYSDNVNVFASVIFKMEPDGSLPKHMVYKIRQNASFTDTTNLVRNRFWFPGPRNWGYNYYQFGFVWIQDILERAMISLYTGRDVTEPGSYIHQFPYPCFIQDQFLFMIEHVMPLCMAISWVYSVAMLVQNIVYEKEQRLKEVMKTMGLNNAVHWLAWFITSFVQMSITSAMLTLILKYGKVLTYSDPILIFLILEIFVIANIAFSFLVSVLYSKAKLAAACAGIIYFLAYVPYMYIAVREEAAHDKIPFWVKSIASLLSTTAFGLGAKYFGFYEEVGVGVQWSNIAKSPVEDDEFSLFSVAVMMVTDAFIYGFLVWYIENVHPGSYGLPKPWYFPFTKTYWLGNPRADMECSWLGEFWRKLFYMRHKNLRNTEADQACAMQSRGVDNRYFEPDPVHLPMGVTIDNLVKVYKNRSKPVVNKLTLNLYEGQITSFLGHNGAGKTTTMSILTGLFPPTSGYATIYGHDIRTEMDTIRQSMGMCPQHNVLFDELTVEEHLWFYLSLKSTPEHNITKEMDKMIEDLALPLKRHSKVDSLSGGMKRKLSVAIAFVGGSRVVILDEPTAGVDPYSRRAIWDLIIKYKKGRTILLSTHHMDEADILGDRIAIISNGQLRCCGTSLFLKNNLGEGYHLCIVKKPTEYPEDESSTERTLTKFICEHVPTAYLACESKRELHYILPSSELRKGSFEKLFAALENRLIDLGISSYGIKNTTLEEVFLLVAEKWYKESPDGDKCPSHDLQSKSHPPASSSAGMPAKGGQPSSAEKPAGSSQSESTSEPASEPKTKRHVRYGSADYYQLESYNQPIMERGKGPQRWEGAGSYRVEGKLLYLQQFGAILLKRYYCTKRNWKGLFSQILLPAFFVSIAMSVALTAPKLEDLPPLILSPSQYYNYTQPLGNVIPYSNNEKDLAEESWSNDSNSDSLVQTLKLPSGVGATCVLTNLTLHFDKINFTVRDYKLVASYFEPMCQSVFVPGLPLENFVPPPPTVSPRVPQSMAVHVLRNKTALSTTTEPPSHKVRYYPYCHCSSDGTGYVCQSYGYKDPPSFKAVTGDILLDVSGQNEHEYYLYTTDMFRLRRYGAFSFGLLRDDVPPDFGKEAPPLFKKIAVRKVAKVWYNNKGYHSMPTYVNSLNNAILRANLPEFKTNPVASSQYGITVINHPMSETSFMLSRDQILQGTDVLIAIFIIVAMSFVPASFVLFLVYERYTKAKHLQFVSGVNAVVYWVANYVWDMCSYVVPATCCVLILLVFDIPAYTSPKNFPAVVSLFLMYGWSITPVMYPVSFIFKEPSTAYIFLIVINLFIGITCVVTSFLLEVFSHDPYLGEVHNILKAIFLMFPNYCLGRGLMDIAFNEYNNFFLFTTGKYEKMQSPFAWNLITRKLVAMAVSGLAFFFITLLCEFNFFIKPKRLTVSSYTVLSDEDEDVTEERKRVLSGKADSDVLRLVNLTKIYHTRKLGKHLAVNKLCLGVPEGECLGLLGVNGAGKSSTFKMLTGDSTITAGDAYLNGYSVYQELHLVQQYIGYCPQFDALFDELTAREHLLLYARFRGIPLKEQNKVVEWALKKLELTQYADKASGTYSGGNKRKLSTAIALIGAPPVIFLDEPTTGMDPYTRRFLWNLIIELVRGGRSVVLTSHSMEECEALCSRLAIMVNGTFRCLGSIQHLKNRFGEGYCITLRTKDKEQEQVQQWFGRVFPDSILKEKHHNMLQYELKSENISLAYVFSKMEAALTDLPVEEYSVCQNTLDNVFINFVKQQSDVGRSSSISNFGKASVPSMAEDPLEDSCDDDVALQMDRSHEEVAPSDAVVKKEPPD